VVVDGNTSKTLEEYLATKKTEWINKNRLYTESQRSRTQDNQKNSYIGRMYEYHQGQYQ
jgi:hypothetical protein